MGSKDKNGNPQVDPVELDTLEKNVCLLNLRLGWRYGMMDRYKIGVDKAMHLAYKPKPCIDKWAADAAKADYEKRVKL